MNQPDLTLAQSTTGIDARALRDLIDHHLVFSIGKDRRSATLADWRLALSRAIRDQIVAPWFRSTHRAYAEDRKRVYYLSMEFLIGRLLEDAIANIGFDDMARQAMEELGVDYAAVLADEPDAALGNGGLGRLAACFLDSMSSIGVPAYGYGIRYDHGLFRQDFENGWQVEEAEDWLVQKHAWEFERRESFFPIGFGGEVEAGSGDAAIWRPGETVIAAAYDTPIIGWRGRWANTLRLWSARPTREFELEAFNRGDFIGAAVPAVLAETISRVLYPDDTTPQGKELRLKQEYFFTAASIRDILRRFLSDHDDLRALPTKAAIQLNDTHPAIAGPELIRLLTDEHGFSFAEAYDIAKGTLNYTNHTLLPEALERWHVDLMGSVLPRHMAIIERIDAQHAAECALAGRTRPDGVRAIEHGEVRMGDLAFMTAHRVNGVSALHTDLMKKTVFRELGELHPDRIVNQTNGVTPRRWLHSCNPPLREVINGAIGDGWVADAERLKGLEAFVDDAGFAESYRNAKLANKARLAAWVAERTGAGAINPDAIFDIQIKRIHEYKRQLMNILETAALWNAMRADPGAGWTPRVKIFGGKAAPGYAAAKLIIKLINDIAAKVNADPRTKDLLRVVYPPNYNISMAEVLIPAADLSEQISLAGMEASGTGNMKFALNGALTIGTLDGANVEIREHVGEDNIFIFGMTADEMAAQRQSGYAPSDFIAADRRLGEVVDQIAAGAFSPEDPDRYAPLVENLRHHDWFMVAADFTSYWEQQRVVDAAWGDQAEWTRRAMLNTARTGWFSSDRTIRSYAADIWGADAIF